MVAAALLGFAVYGFSSGAPSTVAYLGSVVIIGGVIVYFRRGPLHDARALALALNAVIHLAGGLVQVGHDVLYDASIGPRARSLETHLLQFDHFAHAYGSFVAMLTLWVLLVPPDLERWARRNLLVLCALGSLGIGGLNEVIEFIATLAHSGAHVGGYSNTGWDLIFNTIGAGARGVAIDR